MGQHRPINERMEQLQAQMATLQAKAKKDEVNADPQVQAIDAEINDLNNQALKWKRWSKDAEQKIVDFQKRVSEWENRQESADDWLVQYKEDLASLKERRNLVAQEVAKGM